MTCSGDSSSPGQSSRHGAWSEVEQHKLVYHALLNARFKGLTLIDGERLYEGCLCQIDLDGIDCCAPK